MHTFYHHPIIEFHARPGLDVWVLSSMNGIMSVKRADDHSFVLRADRKGWLTNFFAVILRSPARLKPEKVYKKGALRARFVELTPDHRDVFAVRFELDRPLNAPGVLVVYWDGASFRPIDLAGTPVGETVICHLGALTILVLVRHRTCLRFVRGTGASCPDHRSVRDRNVREEGYVARSMRGKVARLSEVLSAEGVTATTIQLGKLAFYH